MLITVKTLEKITSKEANQNMQAVIDGLKLAGEKSGLDKPHRLAMYIGQLAHESANFVYDKEIWGPTKTQKRYDTRTDLGNTPQRDGDGERYRGRGPNQLTGKKNYSLFTDWARLIDRSAPDFTQDPDAVLTDPWEGLSAIWYWSTRGLNKFADKGDYKAVTRRINGGTNGLSDRYAKYVRASLVLLGYEPNDVKGFQKDAGLVVDGIAGNKTRVGLHKALKKSKAVKFNEGGTVGKSIKDKFIPETGQFYKFFSFWGILALGVTPMLADFFTKEENINQILETVPADYLPQAQLVIMAIVTVLNFVKQKNIVKK